MMETGRPLLPAAAGTPSSAGNLPLQIGAALLLALACILAESFTNIDMDLQKLWWNPETSEWLISHEMHEEWSWLFYGGAKKIIACTGILAIFATVDGWLSNRPGLFRNGILDCASVILVPLAIAALKKTTDIYCPFELAEFGGQAAYQRVLALAAPANAPLCSGRCFPAGHASGGFALMMLFFCLRGWRRWAVLAAAWTMGLYQMLRGSRFLTHTLVSMFLAWAIEAALVLAWEKWGGKLQHMLF